MKQTFEEYYSTLFGNRWPSLKNSLSEDGIHATLCCGKEAYYLDPASLCAALCLPLKEKECIADLCAAPGGKSLVTALGMEQTAHLDANERSASRKARLVTVLDQTLNEELRNRITVTCSDAAPWCRTKSECYDAILLDAPCSSERHVLADPKYLGQWTPSRIKSLAMEQWALLSCAWRLLKRGGHVLYATCALNPTENDGVVNRLLKKFDDAVLLEHSQIRDTFCQRLKAQEGFISCEKVDLLSLFDSAEQTQYGLHVLPDTAFGCGPLYFCVIAKS
ncbi:MAG: RsmB/NOP family class I SAM-dependent RNA methyltransferase [Treponema sp.]|nr:RsmB/NOP family class I SAM-dependent RNA methyltransferase [Treponema sp.]